MRKNILHTCTLCIWIIASLSSFFYLSVQIEVSLTKDPTLGLGITGGSDGENTVKPGDTVSSSPSLPPSLHLSLPSTPLSITTLPDQIGLVYAYNIM